MTNCGGVTPFMKIAHLAEAFNLPVTSHGAHDVTVHLLAACPNRSYLEAHGFGLDRYIAEPLAIEDGVALAPDRPGPRHHVRLDGPGRDPGLTGAARKPALAGRLSGFSVQGRSGQAACTASLRVFHSENRMPPAIIARVTPARSPGRACRRTGSRRSSRR